MCASVNIHATCVLLEDRRIFDCKGWKGNKNHKDRWLKPSFSHIHRALNTERVNRSLSVVVCACDYSTKQAEDQARGQPVLQSEDLSQQKDRIQAHGHLSMFPF